MLPLLQPGVSNLVSSYELARILGINQRVVGGLVKRLRDTGHLIGSTHGEGYYLVTNENEYLSTRDHLHARIAGGLKTIEKHDEAWKNSGL